MPLYWRCSWWCRPKTGNCHVRPTMPSSWVTQKRRPCQPMRWQWWMAQRRSPNPIVDRWNCRSKIQIPRACSIGCRMFWDHRRQSSNTAPNQSNRRQRVGQLQRCQTDGQWHRRPHTVWLPSNMHTLAPNDVGHVARCCCCYYCPRIRKNETNKWILKI